MLPRPNHLQSVEQLLEIFPVVGLIGPRQVGKTTLARQLVAGRTDVAAYLDLEDPADLARLAEPDLALRSLRGLVVLDEIQHKPEIFRLLRVLADRDPSPARFLVLGSASPDLLQQTSESLAGRIGYYELTGLRLDEIETGAADRLWLRGGFPRAYLSPDDASSFEWRRQFLRTFVSRDLPELGIGTSRETMRRFWTMLAHWHGQLWNASELGRSFGVADTTVRRYLDLLTSTFVVRQLQPWHENLRKRQVKSPKVYIGDSGILHALLDLPDRAAVESHPKLGASWEGFALENVVSLLGALPEEAHFWATHQGAELDLLIVRGSKRRGFEFKRTTRPIATRSMRFTIKSLGLERLDVIHAGADVFPLAHDIRAVPLTRIEEELEKL